MAVLQSTLLHICVGFCVARFYLMGMQEPLYVERVTKVHVFYMQDTPKIHIGNLIKTELKRQRKTTVWLAEQLGYTRMNVYKIYRRSWISTDLLIRISIILNVDFFVLISEMLNQNKSVNK